MPAPPAPAEVKENCVGCLRRHAKKTLKGIRISVIAVSIIFFILAVCLVITGFVTWDALRDLDPILSSSLPIGLVVMGVALAVVGAIAIFGAFCWGEVILLLNLVLLLVVLLCQIGLSAGIYVEAQNSNSEFRKSWHRNSFSDEKRVELQDTFGCCGYANASDAPGVGGGNCTERSNGDIRSGCGPKMVDFWNYQLEVAGIMGLVCAAFEAIGAVVYGVMYGLLCCLSLSNQKDPYEGRRTRGKKGTRHYELDESDPSAAPARSDRERVMVKFGKKERGWFGS